MKIIKLGKSPLKNVLIGDTAADAKWYKVPDAVRKYAEGIAEGEEVTITFREETRPVYNGNGRTELVKILNRISKGSGPATPSTETPTHEKKNPAEKHPEVQNQIRSQAIGHMVTRTLIALQGHVTPDNVEKLIDQLKAKYESIVSH